ncbi:MAG: hypothetical protein ACYDEB_07775 [Dehalococcoidia bacterium]
MPETLTEPCVHHWVLGAPGEDDLVRGRCKRCGAARAYPASVEPAGRSASEEAAAIGTAVALLPDLGQEPALRARARA